MSTRNSLRRKGSTAQEQEIRWSDLYPPSCKPRLESSGDIVAYKASTSFTAECVGPTQDFCFACDPNCTQRIMPPFQQICSCVSWRGYFVDCGLFVEAVIVPAIQISLSHMQKPGEDAPHVQKLMSLCSTTHSSTNAMIIEVNQTLFPVPEQEDEMNEKMVLRVSSQQENID